MSKPIVLDDNTKEFIAILHRGGVHRFTQDLADYSRSYWSRVDEPLRLPPDHKGAAIYFGVNPTTIRLTEEDRAKHPNKPDAYIEARVASKDRTISSISCLYREYDAKDFAPSKEAFNADVAKYKAMALAHVLSLPVQPSVIIDSGGGYHCYWLLDETFYIRTDEDRAYAKDLQKRWTHADPRADQSACDLRRVLRLPGTTNYKEIYAPNYPTVRFIKFEPKESFTVAYLAGLLPVVIPPLRENHKPKVAQANGVPLLGESVIDAYNKAYLITDVMKQYGYTQFYGVKWNRPGAKSHGCTVFPETNTMYSHSQNDPMYNGSHSSSPFDLKCHFEHNGDCRAAVKAAAAEMGMEKKTRPAEPSFTNLLQAAREWLVTADFSTIIPTHLHSKSGYRTAETDRRAFAACLDVFEKYGKWSGPISQMQGHIASGLSKDSFRSSLNRWLETPFIKRITPPEAIEGGAYFYEINTCVLRAVGVFDKATLPRTKYASVFSEQKAEDAWQLRGSKVQREKALIKACGPAALVLIASLAVGERTHQAVAGARIHKKASTISRIVKRLEDYNMVLLERVGRENFITLLPDWQDRLKEVVPYMPTFGNKERREFNADTLVVEDCDRKLAKGIGDAAKLLSKREQAMCSLAIRMERDMSGIDFDTQSEKMRRLLRYDALRKTASTETKTAKTVEISMINRAKPTPWFESSQPETRRMLDIRQQLEDNETLIDAREQLRRAA